jgi:hypothetical protein
MPATNVMAAVSHTKPLQTILRTQNISRIPPSNYCLSADFGQESLELIITPWAE